MDLVKLGKRIKQERKRNHLLQKELAERIHVNSRHISTIECGTKCPSLELLVEIANALNVGIDTLLIDSLPALQTCDPEQISESVRALSPERQEKLRLAIDFLIENDFV